MKKGMIALAIIIILIIGYIVASWYTGNMIQNQFERKITQLQEKINQNPYLLNVEFQYDDYKKGIFSTSFHIKVNNPKTHHTLVDDVVIIYHGPLPWSELKAGRFLPKMAAVFYRTSQDGNEKLWQASGDQPFMTLNASIDYYDNINILVANQPINYTDDKGRHWQTSQNNLVVSIDKQFDNMSLNGSIGQLIMENSSAAIQRISVNNLSLSGKYITESDQTHNLDQQFRLDELSLLSRLNNDENKLSFNKLVLTFENTQINDTLSGKLLTSVDSLSFDQQNLGKGQMLIGYTFDKNDLDKQNMLASLDKFSWHTQQGELNANFAIQIKEVSLKSYKQLTQDDIVLATSQVNFPLKPLSYLYAQLMNPKQNEPTQNDIDSASQFITVFSQLFLSNSPLIDVNVNSENSDENGLFIDLYYSKEKQEARLKGKALTISQFWQAINHNKLPHF
ncbi:uncharacterized protein DUF945 [Orbus hercynius]|uniref:Uncharacterized protein DUF945 n=1 Tax=Orbus hercynius TaxID=593135 RepID=A0A495RJM1_9GAMM|nr:DUF945 family protein [Orbus hercynius]RKS87504.1 uncharacterized protein DUF945 [Orbus hercynius]